MPSRDRRFPNPFYVLLLVASTAFVVTIFAYLIAPTVLAQAPESVGPDLPGSLAVADWLARSSPRVLAVEIIIRAVAAVLAMATDHVFAARKP